MIEPKTKSKIKEYLEDWIDVLVEEIKSRSSNLKATDFRPPRNISKQANIKPFQEALLPEGILRINEFERTLVTKLGSSYEECAKLIAKQHFPTVERGYKLTGQVYVDAIKKIEKIVNDVSTKQRPTNFLEFVKTITSIKGEKTEERSRIADLYVKGDNGNEVFFEMKSPKPNKGQCVEVLDRQLQIHAIKRDGPPKVRTFFAMQYNPYGISRSNYKHSFSLNYLDMKNQVLLGKEFWDFLGGEGTNDEIIGIYREVGKKKGKDLLDQLALD